MTKPENPDTMGHDRWIFLSHPLGPDMPVYGETHAHPGIEPVRSIRTGNAANVYRITLENHWGTHVDTPAHFFDHGRSIAEFSAAEWVFFKPVVLEITATSGELIGVDPFQNIPKECDLVLVRTGFQRHRGDDVYSHDNPGIHPEVGHWLRENRPKIRAIGMDFVSLSPRRNPQAGRESHRAFLDPETPGNPVVIIEDMDLHHPLATLEHVIVAPLRMVGIDSAPCTVLGRMG